MNTERTSELERRAAKHAALSDPARLRVVDLLTFGDLSPTEIREALGLPANLVTHHLNALEGVGFITRTRSEADRRRSYVHLEENALDEVAFGAGARGAGGQIGPVDLQFSARDDAAPGEAARRVVFVCTANSARSQLATALWQRASSIPATSGGTHPADRIDPGALATARRHDLTLTEHAPRLLADVLTGSDLVVTVCDNAHEELGAAGSLHWSIPDPVRIGTDAAFETAFTELEHRISGLAPRLAAS
ncbi:helix-turn-helix domain-containing protein [Herbiconiux sp. P15]|uniref:arsenate reductase/protein-tyrosine-phosphatase family protein n=1 Tax=Herbiconiux liukaitaii TaxID=3342799 RepID=UPI0035BA1A94